MPETKKRKGFGKGLIIGTAVAASLIGPVELARLILEKRLEHNKEYQQKLKVQIEEFWENELAKFEEELRGMRSKPFSEFESQYNEMNRAIELTNARIKALRGKKQLSEKEKKALQLQLELKKFLGQKQKIMQREWGLRKHERFREKRKRPPINENMASAEPVKSRQADAKIMLRRTQHRA